MQQAGLLATRLACKFFELLALKKPAVISGAYRASSDAAKVGFGAHFATILRVKTNKGKKANVGGNPKSSSIFVELD